MKWTSSVNGWGPVERDRSNGEQAAGDGRPLSLRGKGYSKGLGVHATSDVRIATGGTCTSFLAEVGIDDEASPRGSVKFQVWADGLMIHDSGTLFGNTPVQVISLNIAGKNELSLRVLDGGDGNGSDHADWANAQVRCDSYAPGTKFLSDLPWVSSKNGWGPAERDRSNGENLLGDGKTLTLNGKTYAKGIGAHAASEIRFALGGSCSAFASDIGIDDETGSRGSAIFQVWADGAKLFDSGVMYGDSPTRSVNVRLSGKLELALILTDGGDGIGSDHGDWADARIVCDVQSAPPSVTVVSPVPTADKVALNAAVTATFSKPMNAATVSASTFTLAKQATAGSISAAILYDATGSKATLIPTTVLQAGVTYTAIVKGGVSGMKDLNGNPIPSDQSWSFATQPPDPVVKWVSDINWVSVKNGWGPAERDMSNGESAARDGAPLNINGKIYAKGLGVHANSDIRLNLGGNCTAFTAEIGVDKETAGRGTVIFQVLADGVKLFDSGLLKANMPAAIVNVGVVGRNELALIVTDGGDDNGGDHADWGNAQLSCISYQDTSPPSVISMSPPPGSSGLAINTALVKATFSEALDHTSLTTGNFTLRPAASGTPLATHVSYDAASRSVILDPTISLEAGATYVATLTSGAGGVKDLSGNPLSTNVVWTFTTAANGLQPRAPIVIAGQSNVTLSGIYIRNLDGPCLTIRGGSSNIRLQNSEVGPCKGGVVIDSSSQITIDSTYIRDSGEDGSGVDVVYSQNVAITNNRIERVRSGVYSLGSTGVRVEQNRFKNMQGPMPRGQFVQFNKVYGTGNRIKCNIGENVLGESKPEDAINLYSSTGTALDPIQVTGNKIKGGGPSLSGGGIMTGDGGGSFQLVKDNVLVDPGQYGVAVAGGQDISIMTNLIFAKQQPFTNVGVYVWNQYTAALCQNIRVLSNSVNWTASSGSLNPNWNAGNCGTVADWASNIWNSTLSPIVFDSPAPGCTQ